MKIFFFEKNIFYFLRFFKNRCIIGNNLEKSEKVIFLKKFGQMDKNLPVSKLQKSASKSLINSSTIL
jgi:hypothetical protein